MLKYVLSIWMSAMVVGVLHASAGGSLGNFESQMFEVIHEVEEGEDEVFFPEDVQIVSPPSELSGIIKSISRVREYSVGNVGKKRKVTWHEEVKTAEYTPGELVHQMQASPARLLEQDSRVDAIFESEMGSAYTHKIKLREMKLKSLEDDLESALRRANAYAQREDADLEELSQLIIDKNNALMAYNKQYDVMSSLVSGQVLEKRNGQCYIDMPGWMLEQLDAISNVIKDFEEDYSIKMAEHNEIARLCESGELSSEEIERALIQCDKLELELDNLEKIIPCIKQGFEILSAERNK